MSAAGRKVLEFARGEVGVQEQPDGSNSGPRVNVYKAETWLPAQANWPWCVAFWQFCIHRGLGEKFPYATAAVEQLETYAHKHGLATGSPRAGDAACFNGDHITFFEAPAAGSYFVGLGGNQRNAVRRTEYNRKNVSTWVSTSRVREHLGLPPIKPPRYETVRGEGGQKKTIYIGTNLNKALGRAEKALKSGAKVVKVKSV